MAKPSSPARGVRVRRRRRRRGATALALAAEKLRRQPKPLARPAGNHPKRRLHAELDQLIQVHGAIEVYTVAPDPEALLWRGLPLVNVTAGLELGLIRTLKPQLNRYSLRAVA